MWHERERQRESGGRPRSAGCVRYLPSLARLPCGAGHQVAAPASPSQRQGLGYPYGYPPTCSKAGMQSRSSECRFAFLKSLHFWKRILPAVLSNGVSCETVSQRVKKVKCGDRSRAHLPLRTPRFQHLFPSVAGGNPSNISTLVTEKEA